MDGKATIIVALSLNFVVSAPFEKPPGKATCNSCHPITKGKINVHLIPHSHDDVGWLKTVDQYYYGTAGGFHGYGNAGVQYIISSVVAALKSHPERRFIQVETFFFWKWWQKQPDRVRQDVVDLVNNGQLEIINGAWSMNDEATTHYRSTIDQFTWGFRILNDTLGECGRPKIGWQIDPFGHSREHASLLNQLGFQGLVIGRIDYRDKEKRKATGRLDFLWNTSESLEDTLFTTMFPDLYTAEDGFCFDVLCDDHPIVDDPESPDYNLEIKVQQFANRLNTYLNYYSTSNLLIPMGGDFYFQAAEINFSNLDKLIKGFKDHPSFNVFYSTPSCFIQAVNKEANFESITLTTKTDDFFPYASSHDSYWTGYFTSRPTLKRFERLASNILQSAKQVVSFNKVLGMNEDRVLDDLRDALGIMQHHDAITGTEKQKVADDYSRILSKALRKLEKKTGKMIGNLLKKNITVDLRLKNCLLANISICAETQNQRFIVVVQNPLSRIVTHYVRLPVKTVNFLITGPDGEEDYDVFDAIHNFNYVQESNRPSSKELVFAAKNLPPLGIKVYYVETHNVKKSRYRWFMKMQAEEEYIFGTETNVFTVNASSGKLESITIDRKQLNVTQDFFYYTGSLGNMFGTEKPSGAYVFRPSQNKTAPITTKQIKFLKAKGVLCDELIQIFNDEVTQIIRVYKGKNDSYIEFDWLVGDLQDVKIQDKESAFYYNKQFRGKEVVTKFTVKNFKNDKTFYTDSNGRQQIERVLNFRRDYGYNFSEQPVSSNYYPVTSKIVIKDKKQKLEVAVLNDRAQGGTSLREGEIELMIHRRCQRDDGFGVNEVLDESQYGVGLYARGQHYLTFGSSESTNSRALSNIIVQRELAQRKAQAPWVLVSDATIDEFDTLEKVQNLIHFQFQGLKRSLPINAQILTFEPWKDDTYILRLEHIFEKEEVSKMSGPVAVDFNDLFTIFDILNITETTLGANQFLENFKEEKLLVWNKVAKHPKKSSGMKGPLNVEVTPMQIRTFITTVAKK